MDVLQKISQALQDKDVEINDNEKKINELIDTLATNNGFTKYQDMKIQNLMEYYGNIRAQIIQLDANKIKLDNKTERFQSKIKSIEIKLSHLTEEHQNLYFYYESLQKELSNQVNERNELKNRLEKEKNDKLNNIIILKVSLNDRLNEIKAKTATIESIKNETKANTETEIKKLEMKSKTDTKLMNEKIKELKDENTQLQKELRTKSQQKDIDIRTELADLSKKKKEVSNEMKDLIEEYKLQIKMFENEKNDRERRYQSLQSKYSHIRSLSNNNEPNSHEGTNEIFRADKMSQRFKNEILRNKEKYDRCKLLLQALEVDHKSIKEKINIVIKQKTEKEKQWFEGSKKVEEFEKSMNEKRSKCEERTNRLKQKLIEAKYLLENGDLQIQELEFQRKKLIIDYKEVKRRSQKVANRFSFLQNEVNEMTEKIKKQRVENINNAFKAPQSKQKSEHSLDFDSIIMESTESTKHLSEIEDLESLNSIGTLPEMNNIVKEAKDGLDKFLQELDAEREKVNAMKSEGSEYYNLVEKNKELKEKSEHFKVMNEEIIEMRKRKNLLTSDSGKKPLSNI
ncbi:hypothetical protein TVAG_136600 [Trichomonas vaginalis G3]|uniref:Uncharacterized protein n=1 Tax=Trichomonas vaginalis (strain ATCC PRA-98 / G3) TaxID=412133 RepID=A2DJE2_TRIV3|nr:hypothetical protein TVAGG3_0543250 [Trichomonas vaginalis G3]EAY19529.1 hypothetical protein TVAG_136600 [Trichomonas vaginalis G3]KAI5519989.1 hypothetical protein TVAGG3_0543250 [Trichomonas vaginalis G3]|eukprot:XP_001580515.1 hypothetical protein [Trichomonas vaginalis G3]